MSSEYEVMKVRHKKLGIGLIVPNSMNLIRLDSNSVMVDFEGEFGIRACPEADLHKLGTVVIRFNKRKCIGCAYDNSEACCRFHRGRMGRLLNLTGTEIVPIMTYPDCQDEVVQQLAEKVA